MTRPRSEFPVSFPLFKPVAVLCLGAASAVLANPAADSAAAAPPATTASTLIETPAQAMPARRQAPLRAVEKGSLAPLQVGDVHTMPMPGIQRIAIGNGALVRATVVEGRELVLIAETAGRTHLHVWLRGGRQISYELEVRPSRSKQALAELKQLLEETPGLKARQVGDRLVLEGRYPNNETAARIALLVKSFPQVLNLVPEQASDADPLRLERMVLIDLRVIEVKRRALEALGIRWADTAAGPVLATNALMHSNTPWRPSEFLGFPAVNTANPANHVLGLATKITSALRFLESRGDAWTLAEPRLSCRSGGEATFLAGGEIPIPVAQGNGAISVLYKEYGVRIEFKPLADAQGQIDSALMVEVSEPDQRNANGGFIAFTTNRTDTQVALRSGEPLVIAGLMRQRSEKSSEGVPGLSRLPLISGLFKSRERTSESTELFVIATPRVVAPSDASNQAEIKSADELATRTRQQTSERLDPKPLLPSAEPASTSTHTPPEAY